MKNIFAKTSDKFEIEGNLADDKMKLFVNIEPVAGQSVSKDDIVAVIREFAPNADLHEGVIDDIVKHLNKGEKVSERRISKGTPEINGRDGKLLLLVKKMTQEAEVAVDASGKADYTKLHLFDNVIKGQIVARIYPPKSGTDGVDALGNKVGATPGKPYKASFDKTLVIEESKDHPNEFQVVIAQDDGFIFDDSGKLGVRTELYVRDNVDFRYGNIDFIGSVKVSGDVMPGFNITARKGIEVLGSIRGGSLICMEGDIKVKGFVYGGNQSRVICGKTFTANVVQEINAEIVGDINILKEAIDSNLRTESSLYIKDGQLVGGESFAVCGAEIKFIGNQVAKQTKINLCSDIETRTEYAKLLANIDSHAKAAKMMEAHLGPLAQNPARIQLLKSPHREKIQKIYSKFCEVQESRLNLLGKKKAMLESARSNDVLRINYLSKFYEGVVIQAGGDVFTSSEILEGPGSIDYSITDHKFTVGEFKGLECNIKALAPDGANATKKGEDKK